MPATPLAFDERIDGGVVFDTAPIVHAGGPSAPSGEIVAVHADETPTPIQSSDHQEVELLPLSLSVVTEAPTTQQQDDEDNEDDDELRDFSGSAMVVGASEDAFVYVDNSTFEPSLQGLETQDTVVATNSMHSTFEPSLQGLETHDTVAATSSRHIEHVEQNGNGIGHRATRSRLLTSSSYHARKKEREKTELVQMILESIANVPVAVKRIHTNEKLRAALRQEMGEENVVLHRFFGVGSVGGRYSESESEQLDQSSRGGDSVMNPDEDEDQSEDDDSSSGFGSEYENDLAEAVHQLCMSDDTLTAIERKMSAPIAINSEVFEVSSNRTSNSPQSSINFGASPGNCSQDGEPVSALWPRQPHQFAFTQEEESNVRGEDEVYSEVIGSMCEDESFQGEEEDDENEERDDDEGDEEEGGNDHEYDELEKVFQMDEDNTVALDSHISGYQTRRVFASGATDGLQDGEEEHLETLETDAVDEHGGDDDEEDEDEDEGNDKEHEYEVVQLRIIREKNKTGFEPRRDWRPRVGSLVGGRYKVELAIGEAVFSRTYKCVDTTSNQIVCLKIIKNNKEYFDQGVDEIRLLEYIARNCNVDDKHLVRLLDYFYFREHLIIVTELLRDNLYEFSKLLLERGVINYFNMARLKKISIEVLEALQSLHSLGIVHCDLKPENILISSFNECRVKVIDFGSACFVTDELTSYVQSRSYRAPEVILGLSYDQKIDVWSFGCVLAELFTGEVLFKNDSEQTLLARIIAAVGPIPSTLLEERDDLVDQFRENEFFTVDHDGNGILADAPLRMPSLEQAVQASDKLFVDFLRSLLRIDPSTRLSATEALLHPWLATGVFSALRT
uniref:Protein kinase domain-containing protein n=1 Tax=Globisporangium ultimum (strain ATCC 200006 / CBS 805.95 / DAOM BR144) TaxID=431595 RepID=K3WB66_GLOUD